MAAPDVLTIAVAGVNEAIRHLSNYERVAQAALVLLVDQVEVEYHNAATGRVSVVPSIPAGITFLRPDPAPVVDVEDDYEPPCPSTYDGARCELGASHDSLNHGAIRGTEYVRWTDTQGDFDFSPRDDAEVRSVHSAGCVASVDPQIADCVCDEGPTRVLVPAGPGMGYDPEAGW